MSGPEHNARHDAGHDDYNFTGVRELPGKLPDGERILWQGAPRWTSLFRRAFHGRTIAIYFALLIGSRGVAVIGGGGSVADALLAMSYLLPLAIAGLSMLALVAWLTARATWYTVTSRRVLMRVGVVLEITFNFPHAVIDSAGLCVHGEGTGDIPLRFSNDNSIAYAHLWPHVRPWHFRHTEPMLRSVEEPQKVAQLLAQAIAHATGGTARAIDSNASPRQAPMSGIPAAAGR